MSYSGSEMVEARSDWSYDRDGASEAVGLSEFDESKTVQSEKDDADINIIVKRFGITGRLPEVVRLPEYLDVADGITDYQSALNYVMEAQEAFMEIPAELRSKFDNDPQKYLEFCTEPNNLEEMRKLGLAKPAVAVPEPVPAK